MTQSRRKGAEFERTLARTLREYGYNARRGVQYQGGPDSPDVLGLPGIHIEAKAVERLNIVDAYSQSKADAGVDEFPVVMHKKNYCPIMVTMSLEHWVELYKAFEVELDMEKFTKGFTEKDKEILMRQGSLSKNAGKQSHGNAGGSPALAKLNS